jgi:hypothetical protein
VLADTTATTDIGVDLTGGFAETAGSGVGTFSTEGVTAAEAVQATGGGMSLNQAAQYVQQAASTAKTAVPYIAPVAKALGINLTGPQPNPSQAYGYNAQAPQGQPQPDNTLLYLAGGVGLLLFLL